MSNSYYTHTTFPAANSQGASAGMRGELNAIMAGFDLLPDPLGVGLKGFSDGRWENATIVGGAMDGVVIGDSAPVRAAFTTIIASAAATLSGGGTLAGTFAAGAAGKLTGFGISGGTLDNVPIGGTTRSSALFTTLGVSGVATLDGDVNVGGAFNLKTGQFELGNPANVGAPFMDFHSSGAGSDYDARIIGSGGSATAGQGALGLLAAAITMSVRPSWGATPWDSANLPAPYQNTGGNISGDVTIRNPAGNTEAPRIKFNPGDVAGPSLHSYIAGGLKYFGVTDSTNGFNNLLVRDDGFIAVRGGASFGARPTWGTGATPWDSQNLTNLGQLANTPGYQTAGGSVNFANTANNSNLLGGMAFHWQALGGTPQWVWGGNAGQGGASDGSNMYVWNPAAFSVNFANSAGSAGSVGGVSNPAQAGARVQWDSGIVEFGPLLPGNLMQASAPWMMMGWRTTDSGFLSVADNGHNWIRCVVLRNQ
jgi:hypothetical protein